MGADRGSLTGLAAARALAAQAEDELEAVLSGDLDLYEALVERRAALNAALPDRLPPEAREELEAALGAQRAVSAQLSQLRDGCAADLRQAGTGRRAAGGYAAAAGPLAPRAGALDLAG